MKMVRDFEKRAESVGHPVTDKLSGELRRRVWPATKLQYPYIQPASRKKERLYPQRSLNSL